MLDAGMAEFQAAMQAKARPRRSSTRRSGEIDCSSAPGAAELGRRIRAFWRAAGFDPVIEVVRIGGTSDAPTYGVRSDMIGGLPMQK